MNERYLTDLYTDLIKTAKVGSCVDFDILMRYSFYRLNLFKDLRKHFKKAGFAKWRNVEFYQHSENYIFGISKSLYVNSFLTCGNQHGCYFEKYTKKYSFYINKRLVLNITNLAHL
jgi:hypothetical protein